MDVCVACYTVKAIPQARTTKTKKQLRKKYKVATRDGIQRGEKFTVSARFSAPIQTGPGAHPISCTTDSGSLPPGVK
jgi:hypothetical protein